MDKKEAQILAERFAPSFQCPIISTNFVGKIDGLYVFKYFTSIHGKHISNPLYSAVDENGTIERLYSGDTLYKAMLIVREWNS